MWTSVIIISWKVTEVEKVHREGGVNMSDKTTYESLD